MKPSKFALASLLLTFVGAVSAQQTTKPAPAPTQGTQQLTPEQQAQLARQNAEMVKAAAQVVQLVDQNKTAEVWGGASAVAKGLVTVEEFVKQIGLDRQKVGAFTERKPLAVTRAAYAAGGQVPAGNYVNVVYATKFANSPQPVRELISFHLDNDQVWRVAGYSLR
jgi:hypothetical protein